MAEPAPADRNTERLSVVEDLLEGGTARQVEQTLSALHPAEIADLLESAGTCAQSSMRSGRTSMVRYCSKSAKTDRKSVV